MAVAPLGAMLLLLPLCVSSELSHVGRIEWSSCPVITKDELRSSSPELAQNDPWRWDPFPHFPAGVGVPEPHALFDAKCAQVPVPLNWMNTASGNISVFLKKALASKQPALGDIWLLQGGPGGSGMAMEALATRLLMISGGLEYNIIIPDHRGTGRSTPLHCPDYTQTPTEECTASLISTLGPEYLGHFSNDQAALDVARLAVAIKASSGVHQKLLIYGVSYGSYWLNRILHHAGSAVDGAVMDGLCPPDVCRFAPYYDINTDNAGEDLLQLCVGQSKECRSLLGMWPSATASLQWQLLDAGKHPCLPSTSGGYNVSSLIRWSLAQTLFSAASRVLVPAIVARMSRCSPSDKKELHKYLEIITPPKVIPNITNPMQNPLLFTNIALSEMWSHEATPVTKEALMGVDESRTFSVDIATRVFMTGVGYPRNWPRYRPPTDHASYADYSGPLLMLHGLLDPQTSVGWAQQAQRNFAAAQHRLVFVPYAPHGTAFQSPVLGSSAQCGFEMFRSFVASLDVEKIDDSCLAHVAVPDFDGSTHDTKGFIDAMLGTTAIWGEGTRSVVV